MENKKNNNLFQIFAILITALIIIGTIYFVASGRSDPKDQSLTSPTLTKQSIQTSSPKVKAVDITKVRVAGEPFIGNPKAPVTIALWFDYQCPFCKRFEENTMPAIVANYVNTGKVKIIFKDFAFLGPDSQTAAMVTRAVWKVAPTKFYKWNQAVYTKQDEENSGWGNKADILALVKTIPGISLKKVKQLLTTKSNQYQQEIKANKTEGASFGITGTPSLIIGKNLVAGAQPYSSIKQLIDLELKK